jgi:protein-S-isoprenylcysteine O-methyltransferase Ste14
MSDDISLFHRRMRKPALISLVAGFGLGFVSVQVRRITTTYATPWWWAIIFGVLAATMLYAVSYSNLKKQIERS